VRNENPNGHQCLRRAATTALFTSAQCCRNDTNFAPWLRFVWLSLAAPKSRLSRGTGQYARSAEGSKVKNCAVCIARRGLLPVLSARSPRPVEQVYSAVMLSTFLIANRTDLIERCRAKVAQRPVPMATEKELEDGIPLFLDQLIKTWKSSRHPNR
jgi:hypothetical protein